VNSKPGPAFALRVTLVPPRPGRSKMSLPFNKKQVAKIITEVGADNLTAKGVRERLEQSLGMESNALKQYKQDISTMIDEVLKVCAHSQEPATILRHVTMRVDACRCGPG
jgi:hypothetical protein